jgi:SsrA-binding protein
MATYIKNKKALFNYEVTEKFQAGMELLGHEVKAIRANMGALEGSHVVVRGGEAFLVGATIPPYQPNNTPKDYDPGRSRRLLLTKKELAELSNQESKKGLTIVPISVYNAGRNLKLEIGVARGKKKFDKREDIKKKDTKRDIEREAKHKLR